MSVTAFLELLTREAAAVEFEGPVLEARAQGAAPQVVEELERGKLLALRVRALLERRRRRETELAALFETASDLAGLRDVDAVLEAIVRRARQLLGTDVAYMTLRDDERGDTYMRITDGATSAEFRRVRLPMGEGLGGLVAQTVTPYATANYFDDDRFHHLDGIDYAVRAEGLVGILGVPMKLGTRVIGVLFAANRSVRPFAREEVALLGSLADHATIALDNASLLAETRAALEELSAANDLARAHSTAVERGAEAHERMAALIVGGGGAGDVASVVTDILGGALEVLDADGRVLAAAGDLGDPAPDAPAPDALAEVIAAAHATGRANRRGNLWAAPVAAGTELLGTLVLRTVDKPPRQADIDQRILERAALVTALLLLLRRSVAEAEARVRGELLADLVSGRGHDPDMLRERARRLQVDLDRPHILLVAHHGGDRHRATFWATSFVAPRHGLAAYHGGNTVLLLPDDNATVPARLVARELRATLGLPVTVGAAGPIKDPAAAASAHDEARRTADALAALGRVGDAASSDELGFVGLLIGRHHDVRRFVTATIGPVLDYDARRGTALAQTLTAYFAHGGSLARAAQNLRIHVNTVAQRLERVTQLLSPDWQQADRALEVQLALRLHRVSSAAVDDIRTSAPPDIPA